MYFSFSGPGLFSHFPICNSYLFLEKHRLLLSISAHYTQSTVKYFFLLYVAEYLTHTYSTDCFPVKELDGSYDVSALYNVLTKAISNHSRLYTVTNIITVGICITAGTVTLLPISCKSHLLS